MKAIKIVSAGKAEIQQVPVPKLRDDYVLVKVKYVACELPSYIEMTSCEYILTEECIVNPADWYVLIFRFLASGHRQN